MITNYSFFCPNCQITIKAYDGKCWICGTKDNGRNKQTMPDDDTILMGHEYYKKMKSDYTVCKVLAAISIALIIGFPTYNFIFHTTASTTAQKTQESIESEESLKKERKFIAELYKKEAEEKDADPDKVEFAAHYLNNLRSFWHDGKTSVEEINSSENHYIELYSPGIRKKARAILGEVKSW